MRQYPTLSHFVSSLTLAAVCNSIDNAASNVHLPGLFGALYKKRGNVAVRTFGAGKVLVTGNTKKPVPHEPTNSFLPFNVPNAFSASSSSHVGQQSITEMADSSRVIKAARILEANPLTPPGTPSSAKLAIRSGCTCG